MFAALDAKDSAAVTARMTDDVRMRVGNADLVEGKAKFREATAAFVASINAIRHEITSMWSVDDVVIAEMDVHYERLDGRKVTLPVLQRVPRARWPGVGLSGLPRHRAGVRVTRADSVAESRRG